MEWKEFRWYNSHNKSMTMAEFIELEVEERGNYTQEEIDSWFEMYDIGLNAKVIWVTDRETCADMYSDNGEVFEVAGIIDVIEESYDGDGGYLAILVEFTLTNPSLLLNIEDISISGRKLKVKDDITPLEAANLSILLFAVSEIKNVDVDEFISKNKLERHFDD